MTYPQVEESSGTSASFNSEGRSRSKKNKQLVISFLLQFVAMLGIAVLLYPQAADWFAARGHDSEVSGYVREVEGLPDSERLDKIQQAVDYNTDIPSGVLRDPYSRQLGDEDFSTNQRYRDYLEQLAVGEKDTIGEVSYPGLGISLPIYHGTDDATISKGVGHLYGSSLPVGGPSTHSVMTSHSGLVHSSLFTKLPQAQIGDVFTVKVLGQTHYYQVRNLETVLPHETGGLKVVDGEDWITLLTCTPIGINSHRFLVQAERIPNPPDEGTRVIAGDGVMAGFPWWVVIFLAGSAFTAVLIFKPSRKKRTSSMAKHRLEKSRGPRPRLREKAEEL